MRETYDVVIAGAGPAGAQCARYLTENSKYSVLLLDRTQEIGEPKKSTAGTRPEAVEQFELPKSVMMSAIDTAIIEGPTKQVVLPLKGWRVLEFGKFKKFLVEEAVHRGADVRIGSAVKAPIIEGKKIVGVEYQDFDGPHTVRAQVVIDATGPTAALATQMGLRTLDAVDHWVGMEFEMERLKLKQQHAYVIKLDHRYAPGGYSWIFSTGQNCAKVGNCWNSLIFQQKSGKGSEAKYLEQWIGDDERLQNGVSLEMHAGDAYFDPSVKKRTADNFMAIGDAVCSINPLFGEGIYSALWTGTAAAQTVIEALRKKNTSADQLMQFDRAWEQGPGKHWRITHFFMKRLYNLSNDNYDKVVQQLKKVDPDTLQRFFKYEFALGDVKRILGF